MPEGPEIDPRADRSDPRTTPALLFLVVVVVVGPWVTWLTAQPQSRLALTAAIVDHGTVSLDGFEPGTLGVDRVETEGGSLRSDKAPGQPVLAVPFYGLARAVGAEGAEVPRLKDNLTLWWVTFWTATVPLGAIAVLVLVRARRFRPTAALPAALAITFSTFLLPYGAELYGHCLAAALGYGAWCLLAPGRSAAHVGRDTLLAGAAVGAAVATEYPMVLIAIILAGYLLVSGQARRLVAYLAGGVPFVLLLAAYQNAAFGSPLRTSYSSKFEGRGGIPLGLPDPAKVLEVLAGSKGLIFTPIVFLALYGAWRAVRDRVPERADALIALVVFVSFVLLQSSWPNAYGGEPIGPRYVLAALPFLGVPLAVIWERHRPFARALAVGGATLMAMGVVGLGFVAAGDNYITGMVNNLRDPGPMPVVTTVLFGPIGWLVYAALAGLTVGLLIRAGAGPAPITTPSGEARDAGP